MKSEVITTKEKIVRTVTAKERKRKTALWGWFFIAPTLIGLVILNVIPLFQSLFMSFQNVSTFGTSTFVGMDNYLKMLNDAEFWQSLRNTFFYAIIQVPVTIVLSLFFAVLMNTKVKAVGLYRTIFFLPMIAAPAAIAMVWRWLFNSEYGLINAVMDKVGYTGSIQWITDPEVAIWSIIIVGIWTNVGYNMILLLAGLKEIPKEYYEAAVVDGAGPMKQLFSITLPLLSPQLFFVSVTSVISALQVFDIIFMMFDRTNLALKSTQSLVYMFFNESFVLNDKGYGSAVAISLVLIIMAITGIQLLAQKKWVTYD